MTIRIKPGEVASDTEYHWLSMDTCPIGVKVQLRGIGGIAVYNKWNGKDDFWTHWAPIPTLRKDE